jgi:hypothetical protein
MAAPKTGDSAACLERALLVAYRRALEGGVLEVAHDLMEALVEIQGRRPAELAADGCAAPGTNHGTPSLSPHRPLTTA